MERGAVVLLSGGLDSTTVLAIARSECEPVVALTFRYGQKHDTEIEFARRIATSSGVREHLVLELPFGAIGGSSLLGEGAIPDAGTHPPDEIPSTYVPARNLVFLSLAVAAAEAREIPTIYLGVNAVDFSGYPDCRPKFIASFRQTADLATRAGTAGTHFQLRAPLIDLSKAEIIRRGTLGVDYAQTVSCYAADSSGRACGRCDACHYRRQGFVDAGIPDPTRYVP